jgi:hypothetical protein
MSYGLRIKDSKGKLTIDISDRITRFMWRSAHTSSGGSSGELSQINGLKTAEFSIMVNGTVANSSHLVSRAGNVISWSSQTLSPFISPGTCIIFCFAYT